MNGGEFMLAHRLGHRTIGRGVKVAPLRADARLVCISPQVTCIELGGGSRAGRRASIIGTRSAPTRACSRAVRCRGRVACIESGGRAQAFNLAPSRC